MKNFVNRFIERRTSPLMDNIEETLTIDFPVFAAVGLAALWGFMYLMCE